MEIFEMRYFLAVARFENIHRASEHINVSPGSLSKAIARLESELGIKLFQRQGRNIRLSEAGKIYQKRSSHIVQLTDASKIEIGGNENSVHLDICAEEILQARYGVDLSKSLQGLYPGSTVHYLLAAEPRIVRQIQSGDAHVGIVTTEVPKGLYSKVIDRVSFKTCVGKTHPLYKVADKQDIHVSELLKYDFVAPGFTMLGSVPLNSSLDGWRDDKFKRKITYKACGLKVLEEIVKAGLAIAYLPDHFVAAIGARVINVTGCPYKCVQKIKLIARRPEDISWLDKLLSSYPTK